MGGIVLAEHIKVVEGLAPVVPSSSTPDYISLKDVESVDVLIHVKNATTVTGSAITLHQATTVAGGSVKALAFTTYYRNIDTAASDALTKQTAVSNTFTTDATNSKNLMYRIPVDPASLDVANGFDCIRAGTGDATAATVSVYYLCKLKYGGNVTIQPSLITD